MSETYFVDSSGGIDGDYHELFGRFEEALSAFLGQMDTAEEATLKWSS